MFETREPIPNPDITIKLVKGITHFIPMTCKGEDWLVVTTKQERPRRDLGPADIEGRRSFIIAPKEIAGLEQRAIDAGMVIRRVGPSVRED